MGGGRQGGKGAGLPAGRGDCGPFGLRRMGRASNRTSRVVMSNCHRWIFRHILDRDRSYGRHIRVNPCDTGSRYPEPAQGLAGVGSPMTTYAPCGTGGKPVPHGSGPREITGWTPVAHGSRGVDWIGPSPAHGGALGQCDHARPLDGRAVRRRGAVLCPCCCARSDWVDARRAMRRTVRSLHSRRTRLRPAPANPPATKSG